MLPDSHLERVMHSFTGLLRKLSQPLLVLVQPLFEVAGQDVLLPREFHLKVAGQDVLLPREFHLKVAHSLEVGRQRLQAGLVGGNELLVVGVKPMAHGPCNHRHKRLHGLEDGLGGARQQELCVLGGFGPSQLGCFQLADAREQLERIVPVQLVLLVT